MDHLAAAIACRCCVALHKGEGWTGHFQRVVIAKLPDHGPGQHRLAAAEIAFQVDYAMIERHGDIPAQLPGLFFRRCRQL